MFIDMIRLICAGVGTKLYPTGNALGYKTPSAFQKVISGQDIRLTVLISICNMLGYKIIITNNDNVTIDVIEYYKRKTEQSK